MIYLVAGVTDRSTGADSSAASYPTQGVGRGGFGLPAYSWQVWLGWIALLVAIGALPLIELYNDPSERAVQSPYSTAFWMFGLLATAGYFEFANKRLWRSMGVTQKSDGLSLAVAALGAGVFYLGPLALVLAFLAWRKIRRAGTPIAEGAATAAVAFLAGTLGTIYLILVLAGVLPWQTS